MKNDKKKNKKLLRIIPQVLLLSVFALSSCGNDSSASDCLTKLRGSLDVYQSLLSKAQQDPAALDNNWRSSRDEFSKSLPSIAELPECQGVKTEDIKGYKQIQIDLAEYSKFADDIAMDRSSLKNKLRITASDINGNKITNHGKFINYSSELVQDELQSIDNKLRRQSRTTNEDSVSLSNRIKAIEDLKLNDRLNQLESDVASLKNIVAFISIFNLLAIAGGLGFLVYQVMLKSNSGADRRKKRSSNSLGKPPSPHGQSNPSQSAGMGMGGRRSGGMGSRSQGVEAHSFDEQAPENEDIIPESRNLPRPNFRLNEWRQNQDNRDTQGIEESSNVDHRDALEPPNVPARRGSNRPSVSSNLEHGKLTESLALQHYQSRMYKVLEDFGVGYYSATPESVARNRSDWANPLELVEFFDGLFWIIKTTDRYLLFPNPRLRIEQTRIRGIEYFFETNFTFEGYQSYQVTLPAHVDLINGKWLRLRKGQITFS